MAIFVPENTEVTCNKEFIEYQNFLYKNKKNRILLFPT